MFSPTWFQNSNYATRSCLPFRSFQDVEGMRLLAAFFEFCSFNDQCHQFPRLPRAPSSSAGTSKSHFHGSVVVATFHLLSYAKIFTQLPAQKQNLHCQEQDLHSGGMAMTQTWISMAGAETCSLLSTIAANSTSKIKNCVLKHPKTKFLRLSSGWTIFWR